MKNNARYDEPVRPTGISLCRALARLIALITATTLLAAVAAPPGQSRGTKLKPGDIIYVDSGDGPDGGFVLKVDPVTRKTSVIGSGGHLQLPYGVVIDTNKQIIVSDSGRLIGVNPENGNQSVIADLAQAGWGQPFQIALDSRGFIIA
ncbi:MAG: hypothetical protein L0Y58_22990, partial [Verrucomicrobia subdivision 3 bacterium]|nr:hypothetical protein [Limisphaerales bacterium]